MKRTQLSVGDEVAVKLYGRVTRCVVLETTPWEKVLSFSLQHDFNDDDYETFIEEQKTYRVFTRKYRRASSGSGVLVAPVEYDYGVVARLNTIIGHWDVYNRHIEANKQEAQRVMEKEKAMVEEWTSRAQAAAESLGIELTTIYTYSKTACVPIVALEELAERVRNMEPPF